MRSTRFLSAAVVAVFAAAVTLAPSASASHRFVEQWTVGGEPFSGVAGAGDDDAHFEQVELATARWVHWWNAERLHEACGHIPPAEFEAAYELGVRILQLTYQRQNWVGAGCGEERDAGARGNQAAYGFHRARAEGDIRPGAESTKQLAGILLDFVDRQHDQRLGAGGRHRTDSCARLEPGLGAPLARPHQHDGRAVAGRLADSSLTALALTKRLFFDLDGKSFSEGISLGARVNAAARGTPDFKEAIARFLQQ